MKGVYADTTEYLALSIQRKGITYYRRRLPAHAVRLFIAVPSPTLPARVCVPPPLSLYGAPLPVAVPIT